MSDVVKEGTYKLSCPHTCWTWQMYTIDTKSEKYCVVFAEFSMQYRGSGVVHHFIC